MDKSQTSAKSGITVGKLAGTVVAAGAVLFAAPTAVASADLLGDVGNVVGGTVNQVGTVLQGNVNGLGGIGAGNVSGTGGISAGNVNGLGGILQGNVNNTNNIVRGLLGLH